MAAFPEPHAESSDCLRVLVAALGEMRTLHDLRELECETLRGELVATCECMRAMTDTITEVRRRLIELFPIIK